MRSVWPDAFWEVSMMWRFAMGASPGRVNVTYRTSFFQRYIEEALACIHGVPNGAARVMNFTLAVEDRARIRKGSIDWNETTKVIGDFDLGNSVREFTGLVRTYTSVCSARSISIDTYAEHMFHDSYRGKYRIRWDGRGMCTAERWAAAVA